MGEVVWRVGLACEESDLSSGLSSDELEEEKWRKKEEEWRRREEERWKRGEREGYKNGSSPIEASPLIRRYRGDSFKCIS